MYRQAKAPAAAQEGGHPTAPIEPGPMLGRRGDVEPSAALAPARVQMERETGLIREGDGLVQLKSPALSIAFQ